MKNVYLILMIAFTLLFSSCSSIKVDKKQYSTFYNNTYWDMKKEEVKKIENSEFITDTGDVLRYIPTDIKNPLVPLGVALFETIDLEYKFKDNGLNEIRNTIERMDLEKEQYDKVKNSMISQLGEPKENDQELRPGTDQKLRAHVTTWKKEETTIRLFMWYSISKDLLPNKIELVYQKNESLQ